MENRRKILELIQKNYSWVIATLTSLGILMTFVLKFIKYIKFLKFRFNNYHKSLITIITIKPRFYNQLHGWFL